MKKVEFVFRAFDMGETRYNICLSRYSENIMLRSPKTDRNGKYIYQGDFLQRYKKNGKPYKKLIEVKFNGLAFTGLYNPSECEVVGTIFQNENLLK